MPVINFIACLHGIRSSWKYPQEQFLLTRSTTNLLFVPVYVTISVLHPVCVNKK